VVSITRSARYGYEYRYRVRARDGDEWTDWVSSPEVDVVRYNDTAKQIRYTGRWRSAGSSRYIGGKVRYATARGAKASLTFSGRSVALVGPRGPTRGSAKVYVDGKYVKTVNFYARSFRARQVVFAYNWAKSGTHRIGIVVLGTARHPMVAIDAIYTLR
ncbi:MAG: hypothetical protein ACRDIL_11985, partial [Candidatus Limnocylindrales bacterium]